eukprot:CAMPEP_0172862814 /NCGR_PEP_ID=MMETSP1075-20121228/75482_1 /TAXON_ID=2916 /ORGANISM="Ceratium fusus, Strain PA161109" /LENGTH=37 /DNA_ID= /DNA_START= /DNA_END= /DNA_ORIENTATION=
MKAARAARLSACGAHHNSDCICGGTSLSASNPQGVKA